MTQKQLDFSTRGQHLRILDDVRLPAAAQTAPATMKSVLRVLDSHARGKPTCRVKIKTIAEKLEVDASTVSRALSALRELVLVDVRRTGGASVYRIAWANLAEHVPSENVHDAESESAPCDARSGTTKDQIAHRDNSHREASSETPPPPPRKAGDEWSEVEVVLRDDLEIATAAQCLAACRARSESLATVWEAIAEYRAGMQTERWAGPGALVWRLTNGRFPPPSEAAAARERAAYDRQRQAEEQRKREAEAEALKREQQIEAQRERDFGPAVDSLTDEEALELLADSPMSTAHWRHVRLHDGDPIRNVILRTELLNRIAAKQTPESRS